MPIIDLQHCDSIDLGVTETQLRELKPNRRMVQMTRNVFRDQRTVTK